MGEQDIISLYEICKYANSVNETKYFFTMDVDTKNSRNSMMKYEGDVTICQKCDHIHKLENKLIIFCQNCGNDMRIKFSKEEESVLINQLDMKYKKSRVDDLK